ncbi:MAG: DUF2183 domain-containing protein [Labilithrix sp.]|nr:DUF2183 domain-containing protein [Labilithrix sp.]MCW5809727.1 DUF2183 domain-containing protein [Labilithrix sp.]
MSRSLLPIVVLTALLGACAANAGSDASAESAATAFEAPAEGSCEAGAMLAVANDLSLEVLDDEVGLSRAAAKSIVDHRPLASLEALDAVPQVGPAALSTILAYAKTTRCAPTSGDAEIGLISDLDDTLIPKANPELSKPAVPGIAALYQLLEHRNGGREGDVYYVTARKPDRILEVPAYLEAHGVPTGPIETGTSGAPFIARPEKVRDMEKIFARTGTQRFILFGDSTHVDADVQRDVIAKHPDRVVAGFILKVDEIDPARVSGLHLVNDYAEAAAILVKLGVIEEAEARSVMRAAREQGLAITEARMSELLQ